MWNSAVCLKCFPIEVLVLGFKEQETFNQVGSVINEWLIIQSPVGKFWTECLMWLNS